MKQLLLERQPVRFTITGNQGDTLKIKAQRMSVADEINSNGRLYPLAILQREVNKLQSAIAERRLIGAADHPPGGRTRITDASVRWTRVWMEQNEVHGEGIVLPTQKGKDLEACIRAGVVFSVSQRGYGSVVRQNWHGKEALVALEDFDLQTWDVVVDGAVEGSALALAEQKTTTQKGIVTMKLSSEAALQRKLAGLSIHDVEIIDAAQKPLPAQPLTEEEFRHGSVQRFRQSVAGIREQEKLERQSVPVVKPEELTREQKIQRQLAGFEQP